MKKNIVRQEVYEVGFLLFLLAVIVLSFILFYFGLPRLVSSPQNQVKSEITHFSLTI